MALVKGLWEEACRAHQLPADCAAEWWSYLEQRYSEPQRRYHTMAHLAELTGHFNAHRDSMSAPIEVAWTLLWHDVVYEPKAGAPKNEADSAKVWEEFAAAAKKRGAVGFDDAMVVRISKWILLTANHTAAPADAAPDVKLFLDMDLAILGAHTARYRQYADEIAYEYKHVPRLFYYGGRAKVLSRFAASPRLFRTEYFHTTFGAAAIRNLEWEVAHLTHCRNRLVGGAAAVVFAVASVAGYVWSRG